LIARQVYDFILGFELFNQLDIKRINIIGDKVKISTCSADYVHSKELTL